MFVTQRTYKDKKYILNMVSGDFGKLHNLNGFLPLRKPKVNLAFIFSEENVFLKKALITYFSQTQVALPVYAPRNES